MKELLIGNKEWIVLTLGVTLYYKMSLLQCIYTYKYCVILINYMYLL